MISLTGAPLRAPELLHRMAAALRHRGPDGHGTLEAPDAAIGVERLRIVDPHPHSDQPFASPDGNVWLACNGEIYNAPHLRRRFDTYPWRSAADVETILPLYLKYGVEAIAELDGMFAVALWDRRTRTLVLARDRAGEKPLFYGLFGTELWFASEMQALMGDPSGRRMLDRAALAEYLVLGYVREPRTLLENVRRVPAAHVMVFQGSQLLARRYWDPAPERPHPATPEDTSCIRALLAQAVDRQLDPHAPTGVFVSGGLDSSLVAKLAVNAAGRDRVRTYAVGFPFHSYDERPAAAAVSHWLGTRHVSVEAREDSLRSALDRITRLGEPVADPAALPTLLLAEAARQEVRVVLCGEGADELFGGYPTYLGHRLAQVFVALPGPLRGLVRFVVESLPVSRERVPLEYLLKRFVRAAERPWFERHVDWFGTGLPQTVAADGVEPAVIAPPLMPEADAVGGAMRMDYEAELRERLLVKMDRATMLASLEARAPFLDQEVTRAAFAVTARSHVGLFATKRLLREVAEPLLPAFILHRRKRGLSVPVGSWINTGLAAETNRLLSPDRLAARGLVRPEVVGGLLAEHRTGRANHIRGLWPLIMLEYWFERWNVEVAG